MYALKAAALAFAGTIAVCLAVALVMPGKPAAPPVAVAAQHGPHTPQFLFVAGLGLIRCSDFLESSAIPKPELGQWVLGFFGGRNVAAISADRSANGAVGSKRTPPEVLAELEDSCRTLLKANSNARVWLAAVDAYEKFARLGQ